MLGTPTPTVSEKSKREMARAYAVVCSAEIPVERPHTRMMAVTEAVCRHLLHLPNLFLITQANLYIQSKAETDIEREREREQAGGTERKAKK